MPIQRINLVGQCFGRWTVLAFAYVIRKNAKWHCRCVCGQEKTIWVNSLRSGLSQSCGCLHREKIKERLTKHGHATPGNHSPEYTCWDSMIQRCTNPKAAEYKNYGERGITICSRWRTSFISFLTDMGPRPSSRHSLNRINNALGYFPNNVEWALPATQLRNKRTNHILTFQGRSMVMTDWAKELGIHVATLSGRLRSGWPVEIALTAPVTNHIRRMKNGHII